MNNIIDKFLVNRDYKLRALNYVRDNKKTLRLLYEVKELSTTNKDQLSEVLKELNLLCDFVKSAVKKEYKISIRTLILVISALIYFISPFDIITDFIPFLGYSDDAMVISFVFKQISAELSSYSLWRESNTIILE